MKILIKTQGIKRMDVLLQGLEMAKNYASVAGLNFEYTMQETKQRFTSMSAKNAQGLDVVFINPEQILQGVPEGYKVACLLFDNTGFVPAPTNPSQHPILKNGVNPIQIPENWWATFPQVLADYFLHEICHSGFFFKGQAPQDRTHDQQKYPEWQQKQAHEYYTHLLKELKQYLEDEIQVEPTLRLRSTNKEAVKRLQMLLNQQITAGLL
jgi:hypothetical protein